MRTIRKGFVGACIVVMDHTTWKLVELNEYYDPNMFYTEVLGNLLGNDLLISFALFETFGILELKTFGKSLADLALEPIDTEKITRLVRAETQRLPFRHLDPFPRNILYDGNRVQFIDFQRIDLNKKTSVDFVIENLGYTKKKQRKKCKPFGTRSASSQSSGVSETAF